MKEYLLAEEERGERAYTEQERFRSGLRNTRPHVLLLCSREDASVLRSRLKEGDFALTHVARVASTMELLLMQPDTILACCTHPGQMMRIRSLAPHVPLVNFSPNVDEAHIVSMLDAGADDYVLFTCGKEEVHARLHRHIRRYHETHRSPRSPSGYTWSTRMLESEDRQIRLIVKERMVIVRGHAIHLSTTECALLLSLMREGGNVLAGTALLQAVWGEAYRTELDYLRVYVRQLRLKLEADPKHPIYLQTVPGVGYRFSQPCIPLS